MKTWFSHVHCPGTFQNLYVDIEFYMQKKCKKKQKTKLDVIKILPTNNMHLDAT